MMRLTQKIRQLIIKLILTVLMLSHVANAVAEPSEAELKAVFIFKFLYFTEYPPMLPSSKILLCAMGDNPLQGQLDKVNNREVYGHKISVRYLNNINEIGDCQVLFIGEDDQAVVQTWLKNTQNLPILTISDADDFLEQGGMIKLVRLADRLGFDINLIPINQAKLKLASQLLQLAHQIKGKP